MLRSYLDIIFWPYNAHFLMYFQTENFDIRSEKSKSRLMFILTIIRTKKPIFSYFWKFFLSSSEVILQLFLASKGTILVVQTAWKVEI